MLPFCRLASSHVLRGASSSKISMRNALVRANGRSSLFSTYPSHDVMMMPALSPTMTMGTISKWNVAAGDSVVAGQAIAEIETDKATMTLESMDDNVIGKLLVPEGTEVNVGSPILVLLEEGEDAAPFADFIAPAVEVSPAAAALAASKPKAPEPTPAPTPVAAPLAQVPTPTSLSSSSSAPVSAPAAAASDSLATVAVRTMHRTTTTGPLTAKLAANQHAYIAKYGRGLHKPLPMAAVKK